VMPSGRKLAAVGAEEGTNDGEAVGGLKGKAVGAKVGTTVGVDDGGDVGAAVGTIVGAEGAAEGDLVEVGDGGCVASSDTINKATTAIIIGYIYRPHHRPCTELRRTRHLSYCRFKLQTGPTRVVEGGVVEGRIVEGEIFRNGIRIKGELKL
jgi:hypothetical protein